MRILLLTSLSCLLFLATSSGQQPGILEPVHNIPATIARPAEVSDFEGEWRRMDRQYRLAVEGIGSEEGAKALYFNPEPVNVESVSFQQTEEGPVMQVVLRDEGYPGSTYLLRFMPSLQILVGTYSRPGTPPSEVYFLREKDVE